MVWVYDSKQEVWRETSVLKWRITEILLTIVWPCKVKHGALCFGGKRIEQRLMYCSSALWRLVLVLKRNDNSFQQSAEILSFRHVSSTSMLKSLYCVQIYTEHYLSKLYTTYFRNTYLFYMLKAYISESLCSTKKVLNVYTYPTAIHHACA